MYTMRQIDIWYTSSVVECRNAIPKALGLNPGQARYSHHCYNCIVFNSFQNCFFHTVAASAPISGFLDYFFTSPLHNI